MDSRGPDAVAGWAATGAMWLTGHPDGPPLSPPWAVVPALEAATGTGLPELGEVLTGRAALLGLGRQGRTSANGTCRLLESADGWVALNLARPSDVEALGALFERAVDDDPWAVAARAATRIAAQDLVDRAELLGVPAAVVPPRPRPAGGEPFHLRRQGEARPGAPRPLLVVDLSAMWAGPLCARLLGRAGHRVVKVESTRRPDGARGGHPRFFDWLHHGHPSVALDFGSPSGRTALAQLVARADVVIESSRPRAVAQLGIDAEAVVARRPGTTWVSITGYGRASNRVAFGDDAAAAAGLVARDDDGLPVFCADAIADPITGLYAAVGALTSIAAGGGHLVDAPMVDAVAATLTTPAAPTPDAPVARPRLPAPTPPARPLGADTATVLAEPAAATPC